MANVIVGNASDAADTAKVIMGCISNIDEKNAAAKSMLSNLSGSTKDRAYSEANEIVNDVAKIVNNTRPTLEKLCTVLNRYEEFLSRLT